MWRYAGIVLVACSSTPSAPTTTATTLEQPVQRVEPPARVDDSAAREQARRDELAAAHRELEKEQAEALGATCTAPASAEKHERCLPSCYATEPADARAGKKVKGAVEIAHLVCERAQTYVIADELDTKLAARTVRSRFPKPHKKGTWQETVTTALGVKLPRGDVMVVTSAWRGREHPLTKEQLRCVTVSHYTKRLRRTLDGCGADGAFACEATGNAAARGINVVHYRLAEARRLQSAGKTAECQQAALEAVAVARGLPRWRQYVKLNVAKWVDHPAYRTRFDGILDENTLFATAATLGTDAESVYAACGGGAAKTTAEQEQSFHTCW